jgi:hypothetical protein
MHGTLNNAMMTTNPKKGFFGSVKSSIYELFKKPSVVVVRVPPLVQSF